MLSSLTLSVLGCQGGLDGQGGQAKYSGDFVVAVGQPVRLQSAGTWSRVFSTPEGWLIGTGSQQGFFFAELQKTGDALEDWEAAERELVTDRDDLRFNDYGISQCPDGGYLLGASYDVQRPNDSAYFWTLGSDLQVETSGSLEEASGLRQYNDMAVICSGQNSGIGASIQGMDFGNYLFPFEGGQPLEPIALEDYPRLNGGGLFRHGDSLFAIGMDYNRPFHVNRYRDGWSFEESHEESLLSEPYRTYWSQAGMGVGDHFLVVLMGRSSEWLEGDRGDVYLGIFDDSWALAELVRLTDYEDNVAMRPWFSRDGSRLLVSFDAELEHMVLEVELNLEALGAD